ncbi:hypothetical protein ACFX2C_044018 [Malus domestica]
MAADPSKLQTQIDIKPPPLPFHTESAPETLQEPKLSFFASRYRRTRRRRADTWLISLFVILHIVAFTATMVVNDCWHKSRGDCALKAFGRLSFQPIGSRVQCWKNIGRIMQEGSVGFKGSVGFNDNASICLSSLIDNSSS